MTIRSQVRLTLPTRVAVPVTVAHTFPVRMDPPPGEVVLVVGAVEVVVAAVVVVVGCVVVVVGSVVVVVEVLVVVLVVVELVVVELVVVVHSGKLTPGRTASISQSRASTRFPHTWS